MKTIPYGIGILVYILSSVVQAQQPPLSNGPLFLGGNISPNVMFTLDDSGSMQFEFMPDDLVNTLNAYYYMFPRATGVYGGGEYNNAAIDFDPTNKKPLLFDLVLLTRFITILP